MIAFIGGLFLGFAIGYFICALMVSAKIGDRHMERVDKERVQ